LFGAPVIQDWILTLELSFLLVCWIFIPLCLIIHPSSILAELFYISTWNSQHQAVALAKFRFVATCVGAWIGAIAFPLDWDRPWQKWPIPCLFSAAACHVVVNVFFCLYLLCSQYGRQIRRHFFPKKTRKVKSF